MKKIVLSLLVASLAMWGQSAAKPAAKAPAVKSAALPNSYKDLKYPPINNIKVPEPVRVTLSNGMRVLLIEDRELPTFNAAARIWVGGRWEPADKAGLAGILGTVMRTGGSTNRKGDDLDSLLDRMGASVETGIGNTYGAFSVSGLKNDADLLLSIAADLLQNPALPDDKIDLAKTEIRDSIARRNDDPSSIFGRVADDVVYGKGSPYSREPEYDSIDSITRNDLVAFHKRYFQPESTVLAVWGDFSADEMKAKVEKAFGSWKRGGQGIPQPPAAGATAGAARGIYVVNKDDVNQTKIGLLRLAGKANDPDYFALVVADQILGGGFTSRLFNEVRTKGGLAYDPYSNWGAPYDYPGVFIAQAGTKTETTMQALKLIQQTVGSFATKPVTDKELQGAKDALLKGFAFNFDSSSKIVNRLADYEFFGYPADYLDRYRDNIAKVTKEDIQRVTAKYLKPDEMAIAVVGKVAAFDAKPDSLGLPVTNVDITIPKPKSQQTGAATEETLTKGKQLLSESRAAHGGDKLDAVKEITSMDVIKAQGLEIKRESTMRADGKQFAKLSLPFGEITQGFDGKVTWAKTPQGLQEVPTTADTKQAAVRMLPFLLSKAVLDRVKAQALGVQKFDGKDAEAVQFTDPETGADFRLFLDPASKAIVGLQGEMALMGPKQMVDMVYAGLRDVNGIKFAEKTLIKRNGQTLAETENKDVKLNPGVADTVFAKPAN